MTKLTADEKLSRKHYKAYLRNCGGKLFSFPENGITFVFRQTSKTMGKVSWSICSSDELKFNRKVGEYFALERFTSGVSMPIVLQMDVECQLCELAAVISETNMDYEYPL